MNDGLLWNFGYTSLDIIMALKESFAIITLKMAKNSLKFSQLHWHAPGIITAKYFTKDDPG